MKWPLIFVFFASLSACDDSKNDTPILPYVDTGVATDLDAPDVGDPATEVRAELMFPSDSAPGTTFESCLYASPILYKNDATEQILQAVGPFIVALDPISGQEIWRVEMPAPEGEVAVIIGTPEITAEKLVVAYYATDSAAASDAQPERLRHRVAVVDLKTQALDPAFPTIELTGSFEATGGGVVPFLPSNALARAQVVIAKVAGEMYGHAYVTFGNVRDIQPWHGFAFEIDLDAWGAGGDAITGKLVTTPESDCGQSGVSGSRMRRCGGGLWQPSGPLIVPTTDSYEIILAPGNGQLDLARNDFANTLMRVSPGLAFSPDCDATACADFDSNAPATACVESCTNLFIPRQEDADGPLRPESGVCDGLTMFECWGKLDYVGGSTPTLVELPQAGRLLAYPTKDGAVYLVDADELGIMHDRLQLVAVCGTPDDTCRWDWAGMIVNQPELTTVNGKPVLIIPTFMPDKSHPAGIVALELIDGPQAKLKVLWQTPNFSTPESVTRFREHSSRATIQNVAAGLDVAWVVEAKRQGPGRLVGVRTWDGKMVEDLQMAGPGNRFTKPLVVEDRVYVPSCGNDRASGFVEGYRVLTEAP